MRVCESQKNNFAGVGGEQVLKEISAPQRFPRVRRAGRRPGGRTAQRPTRWTGDGVDEARLEPTFGVADDEGRALRGYKVARARSAVGAGRARGLVQRRRAHRDHGRDFDPIFGPSAGLMITVVVPETGEKMVKNRDFSALKAPGPWPRCARTTWYPPRG